MTYALIVAQFYEMDARENMTKALFHYEHGHDCAGDAYALRSTVLFRMARNINNHLVKARNDYLMYKRIGRIK
jgi:hypothetical protein